MTSRSAAGKGNGRSTTPLITLKMAVFAPMPSASVSTATAVKPGFFSNWRRAKRRSFISARRNIEHRTLNIERRMLSGSRVLAFDVRSSMLDILFVLFITQRLHGIDFRGAPGRQPTGDQRDRDEQ